jgi:hypothetical protein
MFCKSLSSDLCFNQSSLNSNLISSPKPQSLDIIDIVLPQEVDDLDQVLFPLHRQIEKQYQLLPWPDQIKKIVVLTQVQGGRGDIVAAAKTIGLMQKLSPALTFDWVLSGARLDQYDPSSFLNCDDPSKVTIRYWGSEAPEKNPADFLLTGPVKLQWGINYIKTGIKRDINGPVFGFMENAEELSTFYPYILEANFKIFHKEETIDNEIYEKVHSIIFPSKSRNSMGLLPMGVQLGSGLFLDDKRINAPLSRGYCCPSYLLQIQDDGLRMDILEAMNVVDRLSEPDYDQYSFNSGYAHRPVSWAKFIDCVAVQEKSKHTLIVLNQRGEFDNLRTKDFQHQIFTSERLAFLNEKGYGTIVLKGEEEKIILFNEVKNPELERCLTVIIRPCFNPSDMRCMQLASERLLATGDNSALESWCARCKLYLYEDVDNMGCKWRFLQQQVDLAQTISPNLGKLLALFGGDRRLADPSINQPLSKSKMVEMEELLNDPDLSDATLQFCYHITSTYSFYPVLEGALKRTVWHHYMPELSKIEAENLDETFRRGLVTYLENPATSDKVFSVRNLPQLGERVQEFVRRCL